MGITKQQIINYYDQTLKFYDKFWHKDALALHYGLWEKDTKTLTEALLNTNKFLSQAAKISSQDYILDAGCGIGGSSIWLAKNIGVKVLGISLSSKQINKARELARINGVENQTEFIVKDYLHTDFKNNTFDVVWAIESVCHAERKQDFLKESHRILKKGGRLILADGFLYRSPKLNLEKRTYKNFCQGLALPNLAKFNDFENDLKEVGFKKIKFWDKTLEALPSAKKLYNRCLLAHPLAAFLQKLKIISPVITENILAGIAQLKIVNSGLGGYGVFLAEK